MAAPWNPPVKNEDFEFNCSLEDMENPGLFKANPTLAAGDVTVIKDDGTPANIGTLPSAISSGKALDVVLTSTEMNADKVTIIFSDQTDPPEWADLVICIPTTSS